LKAEIRFTFLRHSCLEKTGNVSPGPHHRIETLIKVGKKPVHFAGSTPSTWRHLRWNLDRKLAIHMNLRRSICLVVLSLGFKASGPALAAVNQWTKPTSGNWEDQAYWSLGILPDNSQSVQITNAGWKAIAINPSTPINSPGSMTVSNLTLRGAWDTYNTLILNFAGTAVPLTVLNGLTVADNAQIVNLNSALVVQEGIVTVTNAQIVQDGGFVRATNAPMYLQSAVYQLTNGVFEGGTVRLMHFSSAFNQYGGAATIQNLQFGGVDDTYNLYGGMANFPAGLYVNSDDGYDAGFLHAGGSNYVTALFVSAGLYGGSPYYTFNNGFLGSSNVSVLAGGAGSATFTQNGGLHVITNALDLLGTVRSSINFKIASYVKNNGTLQAGSIVLRAVADFVQSNGVTLVSDTLSLGGSDFFRGDLLLSGGILGVSNVSHGGGGMNVLQTGGSFVITNTLSFGGNPNQGGFRPTFAFENGTLTASNIEVFANLTIGSSFAAGRINNAGLFNLGGTLRIADASESLGRFILVSNSIIDLNGEAGKLSFADSSAEVWNGAAKLIVTNWNWLTSENYLGDELKFGTNQFGLTPAQLQRIHFINPAGYAPGDYAARISGNGTVSPGGTSSADVTNDWAGADGNWHDLTWSLGVRPDSSQTVRILGGNRTVTVNATTAASYPESLTVHDLVVRGSSGTPSLILSNAGTATPLRALNGLSVEDGAKLVNLNSGLIVDGTLFNVTNAQIIQDGGFVRTTNSTLRLLNSTYHMTNGVFEGGTVWAGTPFPALPGQFNQYGGAVKILNLGLYHNYSLYGGTLDLPGGMNLIGQQGGTSYFQAGGTNRTSHVMMQDDYAGSGPHLTLNGGLLAAGDVDVRSGWFGTTTFEQNGGTHIVTNSLKVVGGSTTGATVRPATYYLNAGTLIAGNMELNANQGDSVFVLSNGTAHAETIYAHSVGWFGSFVINMSMSGGSLSCSNFTLDDGRGNFSQSGGAFGVSNLLTITGSRNLNLTYYGSYTFTGGTVTASNLNIAGDWIIGDGSTNRISNPGFISLSHTLQIGNAVEQLGRFILASNAMINLAGSASRLSFANSSGETWVGGAMLMISDWNGNLSGGGAERLKFGTNQSGLTVSQLSQVTFVNPGGFPAGNYPAQILSTGEIVPTSAPPPLAFTSSPDALILSWTGNYQLLTATNVTGPWTPITGATSPFTNAFVDPQRFFQLGLLAP
jgi:hypothetical protein